MQPAAVQREAHCRFPIFSLAAGLVRYNPHYSVFADTIVKPAQNEILLSVCLEKFVAAGSRSYKTQVSFHGFRVSRRDMDNCSGERAGEFTMSNRRVTRAGDRRAGKWVLKSLLLLFW